jgi:hypothetical protein
MKCPCEKCLVKITCKLRMCKNGYLIIENVIKCPFAKRYLGEYNHDIYPKIYSICNTFMIEENFVWQ